MNSIQEKKYRFGESRIKAFNIKSLASGTDQFEKAWIWEKDFFQEEYKFTDFRHYHFWAAFLIESSRNVIENIDKLMIKVTVLPEGWSKEKNRKLIADIQNSLLSHLESIRSIQRESEIFMNAISSVNFAKGDEHQIAITALSESIKQMNRIYEITFNLCNTKLNSIWSSRVTYANILISIIALIVALISLFHN